MRRTPSWSSLHRPREGDPQVAGGAEALAGHDGHLRLLEQAQPPGRRVVRRPCREMARHVGERVEAAGRHDAGDARDGGQRGMDEVTPALVLGQEVLHELLGTGEGLDRAHLGEGGRALGAVRDERGAGVHQRARTHHPADAPARHAVALGGRAQDHEPLARRLPHRAQRRLVPPVEGQPRVGVVVEDGELAAHAPCPR